jgi:hypothetical protein
VLWYLLAEELEFALADALFSDGKEGVEDAALGSQAVGHDLADEAVSRVSLLSRITVSWGTSGLTVPRSQVGAVLIPRTSECPRCRLGRRP